MYVNISRNKILINKKRFSKSEKKPETPVRRCNHCGGALQSNGEYSSCIMCARDANHYCANCMSGHPSEVSEKDKKSA